MGVFDFFFSHSKQKQGKPIRDKIKNRKHFEKVLEKRMTEIHEDKLTISNGCNNLFINRVIADNSIDVIFVKYSMDADIKELKEVLPKYGVTKTLTYKAHRVTEGSEVTQCHGGAEGTKSDGDAAYRFLTNILE